MEYIYAYLSINLTLKQCEVITNYVQGVCSEGF